MVRYVSLLDRTYDGGIKLSTNGGCYRWQTVCPAQGNIVPPMLRQLMQVLMTYKRVLRGAESKTNAVFDQLPC